MGAREKFATQVDTELLGKVREIAHAEGRQIQAVVEEALADLIEKHQQSKPRRHIMAHYQSSIAPFGPLYERLAK